MTNYMRYLNIKTNLTPAPGVGNTSKQVLIFGQRITDGDLILSKNGYTQPNYYKPLLLPSFPDGTSALNYLSNYGFKFQIGVNTSLSLPAPATVTNINGTTVLTWVTPPFGFPQLTNMSLSGTLSQLTVNGSVRSAKIVSGVATLTLTGTIAYVTAADSGTTMTLSGLNNIIYPDPNVSDPICLLVWDFYQTALSANKSSKGVPAAYISVLSDRDTTVNPNPSIIELTTEIASVVINPNQSQTITYTYTALSDLPNFGYLPTSALGNTTVTGTDSEATGIYNGFNIYPTSPIAGTITINVASVTGTFTTADTLDVSLDNTQSAFNYLQNISLYGAVLQFPINNLTDITVTQAAFFEGCKALNISGQVDAANGLTYAMAGNITIPPSSAPSLPAPNEYEYILATYPYYPQFGDIPYDNTDGTVGSGRICAAVMYMLANGDAPFPSLAAANINHLPVSSIANSTSYSTADGSTGDLAVYQGWLPLAPNSNNVVSFLESNTTQITLPGTTVEDVEFRYTHIWDCVRWLKVETAKLYQTISVLPNNTGSALISPQFIKQFRGGIISILNVGESQNIVENVASYENLVTVTQDSTNPNQVDAYIPCQIIPQLNGADILINVFSSLITFQNNQGA